MLGVPPCMQLHRSFVLQTPVLSSESITVYSYKLAFALILTLIMSLLPTIISYTYVIIYPFIFIQLPSMLIAIAMLVCKGALRDLSS